MIAGCRWSGERPLLCGGTGAALPAPALSVPRLECATYVEDQGQSEGCVGEAFAGALWLATRGGKGVRVSPRGIWKGARFRERVRRQDAITNTGCNPADAIDSMIAVGVYARDLSDDNPDTWNRAETWAEVEGSVLVDPSAFLSIEPGDTETVDRCLTAGYGVVYWGDVDLAYSALGGTVWPGLRGPSQGGHARVLVGYQEDGTYLDWNSWGTGWGVGGFGRIARSVVLSGSVGLCAVLGGPVL